MKKWRVDMCVDIDGCMFDDAETKEIAERVAEKRARELLDEYWEQDYVRVYAVNEVTE